MYSGGAIGRKRPARWPQGNRAKTLALIQIAAETGTQIELEEFPHFRFVPAPDKAEPKLKDEPPRKRTVSFPRKAHMKPLKNWRPLALEWGAVDARIPMAGDPPELTEARAKWARGNPTSIREYLAKERARKARASIDAKLATIEPEPLIEPRRTSGRLIRALARRNEAQRA